MSEARLTVRPDGYGRVAAWADRLAPVVFRRGLTPEAILAAARRRTGLDDRAADEVAEPLSRLCADFADIPPTEVGAFVVRTTLQQAMVNRRRLQAIPDPPAPERPPIVLVGWYRTGTTYLQDLLAAVPGYSFVPLHRLIAPVRRPLSWTQAWLGSRTMSCFAPELDVVHPVTAGGPEECWALLALHLAVQGFALHWETPRFREWLAAVDRGPAYREWARTAAHLAHDLGHGLVLKDPAHMVALPEILAAAPDAKLVWTHRDPVKCLASYGSLVAIHHRTVYGWTDADRVGEILLDKLDESLRKGMAAREAIGEGQLVDIAQPDLARDPEGAMERICDALDLPHDGQAVRDRVAGLAGPRLPHRYALSQWALTEDQVRDRLAHYEPSWWTGSATP